MKTLNFFRSVHKVADNVLQLPEGGDYEAQNFQPAQKIIKST
jgi:hypothetical protein